MLAYYNRIYSVIEAKYGKKKSIDLLHNCIIVLTKNNSWESNQWWLVPEDVML